MFIADWRDAVFIHFRVDQAHLQPLVPFELDLFEGEAYVSLVAFTQARLRPAIGGRLTQWLSTPLASHEFLNLRTYVRHEQERGIYFIAEWIPNRLAALIGPRTYGLPYRLGRLEYRVQPARGQVEGLVRALGKEVFYRGRIDASAGFRCAAPGTLEDFLVDRYVAFTSRGDVHRSFHVAHEPWSIAPVRMDQLDTSLIDFIDLGRPAGVQYSPGVQDVCISPPQRKSRRRWCTLG
ncbi:MAG TPA: DUF2071 domain-containing protein [Tepidisphaeraceae bacterium]